MKKILTYLSLLVITFSLADAGTIASQVACTGPNKRGTAYSPGHAPFTFNIPCTQNMMMAGAFADQGAFDMGSKICGLYISPVGAPFNLGGLCGSSNAVAANPGE